MQATPITLGENVLLQIIQGSKLTNRTTYGLAAEWLGHNITYNPKTNTPSNAKDVDLDYNFYNNETKTIIGTICLMIVGWL